MNTLISLPRVKLPKTLTRSLLAGGLLLATAGCASLPPPTAQLAVAEASVKRADTSNTRASAPGELQIAVAKLASARQAAAREDYVLAAQLAEQAEVDAQVAMLHAERVRSQRSAQESLDAAEALREESRRRNL